MGVPSVHTRCECNRTRTYSRASVWLRTLWSQVNRQRAWLQADLFVKCRFPLQAVFKSFSLAMIVWVLVSRDVWRCQANRYTYYRTLRYLAFYGPPGRIHEQQSGYEGVDLIFSDTRNDGCFNSMSLHDHFFDWVQRACYGIWGW